MPTETPESATAAAAPEQGEAALRTEIRKALIAIDQAFFALRRLGLRPLPEGVETVEVRLSEVPRLTDFMEDARAALERTGIV